MMGLLETIAAAIWRETYRHDTLLEWSEIKRGSMHHKRVIAAAKAAYREGQPDLTATAGTATKLC